MSYEELLEKYTKLTIENNTLEQTNKELKQEAKELEQTTKKLKQTNKSLTSENANLNIELSNKILELNALKRYIFGSKREKTPEPVNDEQCSLFDNEEDIEKNVQEQIKEQVEEITVYKKKESKKKKAGIKKSFLKDVLIIKDTHEINENEKCPNCDSDLVLVGKKLEYQEITFTPATLKIVEHIRNVYKCTKCGTDESEKETSTFVKADMPKPLLTHSFASPSLATEVIYQKYSLGVPLYRQEGMWDDKGLVLPRNMMANWCIKISEYYLEGLYKLMAKQIKEKNEVLHCDETTMQCNKEAGRKATSNSYMWVLRSGELEKYKATIFKYSPSRSAETAKEILSGYKGILVTDGYASYNNIADVTHAECWAHCRRYFYDSVPLLENKKMDTTAVGYVGVTYCNKLFKIEEKIAKFDVLEKQRIRQEESKPIVEEFFNWVNTTLSTKVIVNDKLKEALVYASNQQKELSEFLNDGRIPLSNSLAERSIRPFAVHRKNWLFADSVAGANANAVMYSIIETAKINKLNVYKYINYLLEKLPQLENLNDEDILMKYLPWSQELPEEILNCQSTDVDSELKVVSEQ